MEDIKKTGLSRRTIVKGAAWSVPVIAAAVAVPMAAASGEDPLFNGVLLVSSSDISPINATFGSFELTPQNVSHEAIPDVVTTVTLTYSGPAGFDFLAATVVAPWTVVEKTANTLTVVTPPRQVHNGGYAADGLSIYFGGKSAATVNSITATASTSSASTGFYNTGLAINPFEGTGSVTGPTAVFV